MVSETTPGLCRPFMNECFNQIYSILNSFYHCAVRFVTGDIHLSHYCELCAKANGLL